MSETFIYALCAPDTGEVRYVGKSNNPRQRLSYHLCKNDINCETHKARWLRQLKAAKQKPLLLILERVVNRTWQEAEKEWIAFYRAQGARLTNATPGGDGIAEYTPEIRKNISQGVRKGLAPAEVRARKSQAMKKVWANPEIRARLLSRTWGRISPEHRAKLNAAVKGLAKSPEHRAKISAAQAGRKKSGHKGYAKSAEHRAKLSAALKGRAKPAETIARMREASKRREAEKRKPPVLVGIVPGAGADQVTCSIPDSRS